MREQKGRTFTPFFAALLHTIPRNLRKLSLPFLDGSMPFHSFVTPVQRVEAGNPNGTGLGPFVQCNPVLRAILKSCE